ncbi:hypothetical protein [Nocardioides jiangxiensis]|uniref:DUF3592 domain-containing protein n=1 Tax=Nocardioides jiangxiensis TaxID=3064524 RepID=A0ABT9B0T6_9ACTN|nr:hypothetical protein [Nocardioides sp. WY-20]MDO7868283.1 hypothetical protein [Nocardioides sp. WY-20]
MTPLPTGRRAASRRAAILMVVALLLLFTVPAVWSAWNAWRLDAVGVSTVATVTDTEAVPKKDPTQFFVRYYLPADADPRRGDYIAKVSEAAWQAAQESDTIEATYLEGKPGVNRVEGQVRSHFGLVLTVLGDLALLAMLALALKFRPARDKPLVLLATADVVRARPGFAVEKDGVEHVVRGDVVRIGDGEIALHVGEGREVRVVLGEYRNPVGYQQPAEVRGRRFEP